MITAKYEKTLPEFRKIPEKEKIEIIKKVKFII
jgi:hypothetical protein